MKNRNSYWMSLFYCSSFLLKDTSQIDAVTRLCTSNVIYFERETINRHTQDLCYNLQNFSIHLQFLSSNLYRQKMLKEQSNGQLFMFYSNLTNMCLSGNYETNITCNLVRRAIRFLKLEV